MLFLVLAKIYKRRGGELLNVCFCVSKGIIVL
jgi:hypothetical protein